MKIRFILTVFILLAVIKVFSQPLAVELWKVTGSTGDERARSAKQTPDGGYIMTGYTTSNDTIFSANHGLADCYVAKYTFNGTLVWQKLLGGSDDDFGWNIQLTNDGGYVLFANTSSNDGDVTNNSGGANLWVVKLDFNGNIIWDYCYQPPTFGIVNIYDVIPTSDGNYALVSSGLMYQIIKIDTLGNVLWSKAYGGTQNQNSYGIKETPDKGFLVVGYTVSNDLSVTCNPILADCWLLKLDSLGDIEYQNCIGGSNQDYVTSITRVSDGDFIITGYSASSNLWLDHNYGGYDYWILKIDSTLGIEWSKSFGGSGDDYGIETIETSYGYLVAGYSNSNDYDVSGNNGDNDIWLVALNDTGALLWQHCYGDAGSNLVAELDPAANDGAIISGRSDNDMLFIKLAGDYNSIEGNVYFDANNNQIKEGGENPIPYKTITETTTGRIAFTKADGSYQLAVTDTGNFTVAVNPIDYCMPVPVQQNANFSSLHLNDVANDFAMQVSSTSNDLAVTLTPTGLFRAGRNSYYTLSYFNRGTTSINATAYFVPDDSVTYANSSVIPTTVTPDSLSWNLGLLAPFAYGNIFITVIPDVAIAAGSSVSSIGRIEPVSGDALSINNIFSATSFITASYDPNNILVDKNKINAAQISNPPYLEYIINYQNTGNDTAFVVRVKNDLSSLVDVTTFELLSTSHNTAMKYDASNKQMEFTMDNILLPDSSTDEAASHGFIHYKIKPRTTLTVTDTIKSSAAIYFDYNLPVFTNTALTWIDVFVNVDDIKNFGEDVTIYPNPSNTVCNIRAPEFMDAILYMHDMDGRLIGCHHFKQQLSIILTNISQGMYIFELLDNSGKSIRKKFIKKD